MACCKTSYIFLILAAAANANLLRGGGFFTPLKNDEHPCVAENLKESHRYICDDDANVICLAGYREPADVDLRDLKNPCPEPICDYEGRTCLHGECVRPNVCACKVGWEGHLCDRCVPLPGCDHGTCNDAFECNCETDGKGQPIWEGAFCDQPACPAATCDPAHGQCFEPHVCTCHDGWTGADCKTCEKLPGCLNGECKDGDKPNTCECNPGWTGHLCDQPICRVGCHDENGYCEEPDTCLCKTGWSGPTCSECVPYWECPAGGTCHEPNQCVCAPGNPDPHCNRDSINGPRFSEFSECSNPCKHNAAIETSLTIGAGTKVSECRWNEAGACVDRQESCYGDREWTTVSPSPGRVSEPHNCLYVAGFIVTNKAPSNFTTTTIAPPPSGASGRGKGAGR